jgi:phage-related protein (TIGR01555 family)
MEAPSLIRGYFMGWGMSELERLVRSFNQFLKHQNVVFELLDEAKIDVFKIDGFSANLMSDQGTQKTAKRIQLAAQLKNFQNALTMDKNDDYEQKQISFSGLSEILNEIYKGIANDTHMPISKLFGTHPSGLNAADDDLENYNAMVETEIRSKIKSGLLEMLKISCQKIFGFVPETIDFTFKPLRILSHEQEETVKNNKLERILKAEQSGIFSAEKAVEMLNAEKIFPLDLNPHESMSLEELADLKGLSLESVQSKPEMT